MLAHTTHKEAVMSKFVFYMRKVLNLKNLVMLYKIIVFLVVLACISASFYLGLLNTGKNEPHTSNKIRQVL
ncbi:hypothetical protein [Helicobacter typhlonius]|uniref:hypothetical protein n=1 Tax=Helicobacter typhlonius TaxID=76936 RepID=UPI002FE23A1B